MAGTRPQGGGRRPRMTSRGRGRGRGRGARSANSRETFRSSRLRPTEDEAASDIGSESGNLSTEDEQDALDVDSEEGSVSDEPQTAANSYATLLQSLSRQQKGEPSRKKPKLAHSSDPDGGRSVVERKDDASPETINVAGDQVDLSLDLQEVVEDEEEEEQSADATHDIDSEDEEENLSDPFERHYSLWSEPELQTAMKQVDERQWESQSSTVGQDLRRTIISRKGSSVTLRPVKTSKDLYLKRRLAEASSALVSSLTPDYKDLAQSIFNYTDVVHGRRTLKNLPTLRDLCSLHALNHIFKTRDRVLKNTAKLNAQSGVESLDIRDQGFTRPKVLIIVPTKQSCVRFVDSIVGLSEPDQQENKSRFLDTYSHEDEAEWDGKPADFVELFGGNHEEDFRIGLKFTRKTIKYFSGFYNSDIILGSPLGLMRTITTGGGGGGKTKKNVHDADFLSSIEVVIMDNASALQMQNWAHVEYVFSQLNLIPKDSHGCDFSRVRHWYLDGHAKYLRQTIVLSAYLTPEINSLTSNHTFNLAGRTKLQHVYEGTLLNAPSLVPFPITQSFHRFQSVSPAADPDKRFAHFTTTTLPPLLRDKHLRGLMLFVPTYADFTRLRNYLATSSETANLSFGSVSEYTARKDMLRARSHFLNGRHGVLLYSERAHHHFRYRLKGVRKIVFYGVPENPVFWDEVVGLLGLGYEAGDERAARGKGAVKALFSKWDAMKLERIVGTARVGRLLNERSGDTFEFA